MPCFCPGDFITPILRAHVSADSLPHPNPQPTLALGPVTSPSPRRKQSHQLLALEILRALNILCRGAEGTVCGPVWTNQQ